MKLRLFALLATILVFVFGCEAQPPLYGIDFSPYITGQDPNLNSQVSVTQLQTRMQIIAPHFKWVRSFGSTAGLENIPSVARQFGLKVVANAWIGKDPAQNALEIANLIANIHAGQVDIAVVGSEALLRNDVTEAQLIAYMNQVRQAIGGAIPVTTADTYGTLIDHPNVIAASDILFGNFYPYWEGISLGNSICALNQQYNELAAVAGGKQIYVSETGWPSDGDAVGAAIPSPDAAAQYFAQFVTWANSRNVPFFYFSALDENWKIASEGPQGAHWGVWDANGVLKPGMQATINGQASPVTCDGTVGGPGAPSLTLTYVPPYGSSNPLEGQVQHVSPASYSIALAIKVNGTFWTKPTAAQPLTPIRADGSFSSSITTGGNDTQASDVVAFLVPSSFTPPILLGAGALPDALFTNSVAHVQVQRSTGSISGVVLDNLGHPVPNVSMSGNQLGTTPTSATGRYSFYNLPASGIATITPGGPNIVFNPASTSLTITSGAQQANFTAVPTVDLSVTAALSAMSIILGSSDTATVVVSNAGVNPASNATATISIPGSTIQSASSTSGTCSIASPQITCAIGGLQPTAYAVITIVSTPAAAGSLTIAASVTGADPDQSLANNSASLTLNVTPGSGTASFTPIRVNAGGASYTDSLGNVWGADNGFLGGASFATSNSIGNTSTAPLYQSERYNDPTVQYVFTVPNGTYTVNLKFAEIYFTSPGQRVFNILLNGQTVQSNFDPLLAAGGANLAIDKPFTVTVTNGQINIQLISVVSNPKISAIEITSGAAPPPNPTGSFTPIRVNAGGASYIDAHGNVWSADSGFVGGASFATSNSIGNTSTAPLYQSERWNYPTVQYVFTVPNGTYAVNLKFAEIYFTNPGQRVFNILLNGQTVQSNFDPLLAAGGANLAIDKPFTVTVTNGQINIQLVSVVSNPKISAIEITGGGA